MIEKNHCKSNPAERELILLSGILECLKKLKIYILIVLINHNICNKKKLTYSKGMSQHVKIIKAYTEKVSTLINVKDLSLRCKERGGKRKLKNCASWDQDSSQAGLKRNNLPT